MTTTPTTATTANQPKSGDVDATTTTATTTTTTISPCTQNNEEETMLYAITITGLQLKNIFCYPQFYWYAIAALNGAKMAPGNIHASTNSYNLPNDSDGDHNNDDTDDTTPVVVLRDTLMTLTVWDHRASTLNYVYHDPSHRAAMKQIKQLSDYSKTYHYESTTIPTWEEAKELWLLHRKEYRHGNTNISKKGEIQVDHTKHNNEATEKTTAAVRNDVVVGGEK